MEEPKIALSVYLDKPDYEALGLESKELGVSVSQFIRLLVRQYFDPSITFGRKNDNREPAKTTGS